jgi:orotidine-5'-phosphate decarboxylase
MSRNTKINSASRLYSEITKKQSFLCLGLDPDPAKIPSSFGEGVAAMEKFCKEIVRVTKHVAVSYKPNLAFFEMYGAEGWSALERIVQDIPDECLVIADAKRGDIGNTASKYAVAMFDTLGADAITVAPYMGADSVTPFIERDDKWTILLALTSNKGADDFEFHGTPPLYQVVLEKSKHWGTEDNLMYVVGATRPEMFTEIRKIVPHSFLLVPGVGAQGGSLELVAKYGMNDQCGLLVNSSRGILYAGGIEASEESALEASKAAAEKLAAEMSKILR